MRDGLHNKTSIFFVLGGRNKNLAKQQQQNQNQPQSNYGITFADIEDKYGKPPQPQSSTHATAGAASAVLPTNDRARYYSLTVMVIYLVSQKLEG